MNPVRVLIVDDEPDVRLTLSLQLRQAPGVEVVGGAGDGAEALSMARQLRPDAVVLDLLMPGTNGFEAIEQFRAEMPEVALVAYSGVAGDFVRSEMARLDVPLVLKSGDVSRLVEALTAVAAPAEGST